MASINPVSADPAVGVGELGLQLPRFACVLVEEDLVGDIAVTLEIVPVSRELFKTSFEAMMRFLLFETKSSTSCVAFAPLGV